MLPMVRNPPPTKGRSHEPLLLEVSSVAEHGASAAGAVILNRVTVTGPAGTTAGLAAILESPVLRESTNSGSCWLQSDTARPVKTKPSLPPPAF